MSCELCSGFDRWIERLAAAEPVGDYEAAELREWLIALREQHIDGSGGE